MLLTLLKPIDALLSNQWSSQIFVNNVFSGYTRQFFMYPSFLRSSNVEWPKLVESSGGTAD